MSLFDHIKTALEQNESYCKDGLLFKNVVVEAALKMDPALIKLLLSDDKAKKHFFIDVDGVAVFDKVKLQKFISNKQFLPDSFTAYKNKIGLTANGEYLTEANEVVLDFPYKDCVLEGGQTKEDQKRQEIFWNETLAPDEIDRLFEPKVLTNWKRYDKDGEQNVGKLTKTDNLIIKGNNLLALHSLLPKYKGQVKLIYIDPPYNTGNDSFKYNDGFNHSTWLTFMQNRLQVAKKLLHPNGSIFLQIDYNEAHYCKIMMDFVFERSNLKNEIIWQRTTNTGSSKGMAQKLSSDTDTILYYGRNSNPTFNKIYKPYSEDYLKRFKYEDAKGKYRWQYMATYSQKKLKELQDADMIRWNDKSKNPEYKQYLDSLNGIPLNNLWTDIFHVNPMAKEGTGFKTQKPEELLERIIQLSTNEGDIVLDFFAGSGTTAAVAHKMSRRFISTEQMDYVNTVTIERLKKVINGEQGGISEKVKWKGGGSFVYAELAKDNASYIDDIEKAKTSKALLKIWNSLKDEAFISYKVNPKDIDNSIEDFKSLALDDQKKLLISLLDKNQLYVNYNDIDDKDHKISKEDKELNHKFYGL